VVGGSTPSRERPGFFGGDLAWATPTDVTNIHGRYIEETATTITEEGRDSAGLHVLPPGSVLLTSRATIGAAVINTIPITTNQGFQSLIPKTGTDALWLYYAISSMRPTLERLAAGSTFRELHRQTVRKLQVPTPCSRNEQEAIATVLDSIDAAIEKTEAVIAATEQTRSALLQELLTHGLPGQHSAWKEVPGVGTMPKCWEVVELGDVSEELRYGTSERCGTEPEGVPVLRIPNVASGVIDTTDLKFAELSPEEQGRLRLRDGDLLVVRTNGNPSVCGRFATFRDLPGSWSFASYLIRIRVRPAEVLPDFVSHYLNSAGGRSQLRGRIRTSAGNYNISASGLASVLIAKPSMSEQEEIIETIRSVDSRALADQAVLSDIRRLKDAVSEALLSGRVRVSGSTNG
jgi:type I restriction enzyme S subunit